MQLDRNSCYIVICRASSLQMGRDGKRNSSKTNACMKCCVLHFIETTFIRESLLSFSLLVYNRHLLGQIMP